MRFLALLASLLLIAAPAYAVPGYAQDASQALTPTPAAVTLTADGDLSVRVPDRAVWGMASCDFTSVAGGATTITWYVSLDSAGDRPITPEQTDTIVQQTATKGAVARSLGVPIVTTGGSAYIWAWTNVGTATAKCRLYWE